MQSEKFRLDDKQVQTDKPYNNNNQAQVLDHMAAEWNNENGGGVTGGHLLLTMVGKWGQARTGTPTPQTGQNFEDGIYFESRVPNNKKVVNNDHPFKIVKTVGGRKKVSGRKAMSTFWPVDWGNDKLAETLNASWQLGAENDKYASRANTKSYWYQWQTLGGGTLFPNGALAVTNSERQYMRKKRQEHLDYANRKN